MVFDTTTTNDITMTGDNIFLICAVTIYRSTLRPQTDLFFCRHAFLPTAHCSTFCSCPTRKPKHATTKRAAIARPQTVVRQSCLFVMTSYICSFKRTNN